VRTWLSLTSASACGSHGPSEELVQRTCEARRGLRACLRRIFFRRVTNLTSPENRNRPEAIGLVALEPGCREYRRAGRRQHVPDRQDRHCGAEGTFPRAAHSGRCTLCLLHDRTRADAARARDPSMLQTRPTRWRSLVIDGTKPSSRVPKGRRAHVMARSNTGEDGDEKCQRHHVSRRLGRIPPSALTNFDTIDSSMPGGSRGCAYRGLRVPDDQVLEQSRRIQIRADQAVARAAVALHARHGATTRAHEIARNSLHAPGIRQVAASIMRRGVYARGNAIDLQQAGIDDRLVAAVLDGGSLGTLKARWRRSR